MLMYRCLDCDAEFEEPKTIYGESLEHFGRPCREVWAVCPMCGSDQIEELEDIYGEEAEDYAAGF